LSSSGSRILRHIATLGFVGFVPVAPGTAAALLAFVLVALVNVPTPLYVFFTLAVIVVGTISAGAVEGLSRDKDPAHVVIDEFAGYLVAAAFLPGTWGYLVAAFILFRAFDILKPPPIRRLQKLRGGPGIMADDLVAGLFSNVLLQIWRMIP
jgi:phosphatidylglycerophosphatase A